MSHVFAGTGLIRVRFVAFSPFIGSLPTTAANAEKCLQALSSKTQLTSYTSSHSSVFRCSWFHRIRVSVNQYVFVPVGNEGAKFPICIAAADICSTRWH